MENVPIGMLFCAEVEGGRMVWADAEQPLELEAPKAP